MTTTRVGMPLADGWSKFAETVLPTIGGTNHAEAHVAFHFDAMYVLQIAQQVIAAERVNDFETPGVVRLASKRV